MILNIGKIIKLMIVYQALAREEIIKKNWHVSEFELDTPVLMDWAFRH